MRNRKSLRFIALAIFILLLFQLIPLASSYADAFQKHTVTSSTFFSSERNHTDILYIGKVDQKSLIKNLQHRSNPILIVQAVTSEGITAVNKAFQDEPLDYRKIIRQSIANYFNGSKYKNETFVI